jgi:hypothetical protein
MDAPTKTSTPASEPSRPELHPSGEPNLEGVKDWEELGAMLEKHPELRGGQGSISVRGQEVWNSATPELSDVEGVNARVRSAMSLPSSLPSREKQDSALEKMNSLPD